MPYDLSMFAALLTSEYLTLPFFTLLGRKTPISDSDDVQMKQLWKDELISAKTRCWAQGMDGWRALHLIPQLKWSLLATGQALMNETDLATLVLNMLIRMCEYYPSRYDSPRRV